MVGEISGQRSLRRESVRSGDYAVGEMYFWELSIGDLPSRKCQSGNYPVGELPVYHHLYKQESFGTNKYKEKGRKGIINVTIVSLSFARQTLSMWVQIPLEKSIMLIYFLFTQNYVQFFRCHISACKKFLTLFHSFLFRK